MSDTPRQTAGSCVIINKTATSNPNITPPSYQIIPRYVFSFCLIPCLQSPAQVNSANTVLVVTSGIATTFMALMHLAQVDSTLSDTTQPIVIREA